MRMASIAAITDHPGHQPRVFAEPPEVPLMQKAAFVELVHRLFGARPNNHDVAEWLSVYRETSPASVSLWLSEKSDRGPAAWIDVKLPELIADRRKAVAELLEGIDDVSGRLEGSVIPRLSDETIRTMRAKRKHADG